jgi:hypothetical protein
MNDDRISLKEYIERILVERDKAVTAALAAAEKQTAAELKNQEKAVEKAEIALKEYKMSANEFRGTLKDQAATFMPRAEAESRFAQQAEKIRALELSERAGEGGSRVAKEARANSQWIIGLIVAIALGLFGYFISRP